MQVQTLLKESYNNVEAAVAKYPYCMPVSVVSELLHTSEESLRAAIDQGRLSFAYSWQCDSRRSYKIVTAAFLRWFFMTAGADLKGEVS